MKKVLIIVLTITFLYSCKQNTIQETFLPDLEDGDWNYTKDYDLVKSGKYRDGYKTGSWKYRINNETQNLYWMVYETPQIKINHPKSWRITENTNDLFYSIVNKEDGDFFLINRYSEEEFKITLDGYFDKAIARLKQIDDEEIIDYVCIKLKYKKRDAYYLRFNTKKENHKTAYYIFYTQDDGFVYDITFKVGGESKKLSKEIFAAMVYSLGVEGEKLFNNNDTVIKSEQVRIEGLN